MVSGNGIISELRHLRANAPHLFSCFSFGIEGKRPFSDYSCHMWRCRAKNGTMSDFLSPQKEHLREYLRYNFACTRDVGVCYHWNFGVITVVQHYSTEHVVDPFNTVDSKSLDLFSSNSLDFHFTSAIHFLHFYLACHQ